MFTIEARFGKLLKGISYRTWLRIYLGSYWNMVYYVTRIGTRFGNLLKLYTCMWLRLNLANLWKIRYFVYLNEAKFGKLLKLHPCMWLRLDLANDWNKGLFMFNGEAIFGNYWNMVHSVYVIEVRFGTWDTVCLHMMLDLARYRNMVYSVNPIPVRFSKPLKHSALCV